MADPDPSVVDESDLEENCFLTFIYRDSEFVCGESAKLLLSCVEQMNFGLGEWGTCEIQVFEVELASGRVCFATQGFVLGNYSQALHNFGPQEVDRAVRDHVIHVLEALVNNHDPSLILAVVQAQEYFDRLAEATIVEDEDDHPDYST